MWEEGRGNEGTKWLVAGHKDALLTPKFYITSDAYDSEWGTGRDFMNKLLSKVVKSRGSGSHTLKQR
jgi:hypothetical protein